jgi:hypothetical protein
VFDIRLVSSRTVACGSKGVPLSLGARNSADAAPREVGRMAFGAMDEEETSKDLHGEGH